MSKLAVGSSWRMASWSAAVVMSAALCGAALGQEPKCDCPFSVEVRHVGHVGTPLLMKVPYVNRLFKNVGIATVECNKAECNKGECNKGECRTAAGPERIGVDFEFNVVAAHQPQCQAVETVKACDKVCQPAELTTSRPPHEKSFYFEVKPQLTLAGLTAGELACVKKCLDCPCTGPVNAVAAHCTAAGDCQANKVCPDTMATSQPACCCKDGCSAAACAAGQCPAAAQCAQRRLPGPVVAFGGEPIFAPWSDVFPPPMVMPWMAPPPSAGPWTHEMHESLIELAMERAALEAVLEVREELLHARTESLAMVAELITEKTKAETRCEMFEVLAKTLVEKAKLEARVELHAEQMKLAGQMHTLIAENARLKAQQELTSQREELLREAMHLTLENERLKRHVAELERQPGARTATRPQSDPR